MSLKDLFNSDSIEEETKILETFNPRKVADTKHSKFLYTPSVGEQLVANRTSTKQRDTLNNKELTWWEENSIFKHPGMLVSAFYGMNDRIDPYRKKMNISKDTLFIGDSGGFQKVTLCSKPAYSKQTDRLTAENVIAWQEKNCDIGFVLDKPPYMKMDNDVNVSWSDTTSANIFKESIEFTRNSTEVAVNMHNNKKMKLYGVIQGSNYSELLQWYNAMKPYEDGLDGWALAPKPPSDVKMLTMMLSFCIEMGIDKPIHGFAISGLNTLAIIIYLLRKDEHGEPYFSHFITTDSSSYNTGSIFRRYQMPFDFNNYLIIGRNEPVLDAQGNVHKEANPKATNITDLPCDCAICKNTTVEAMREPTNLGGVSISLHNLNQYLAFIKVLISLVDEPTEYKNFIKRQAIRSFNTDNLQTADDLHKSLKYMKVLDKIVQYKGQKKMVFESVVNQTKPILSMFK